MRKLHIKLLRFSLLPKLGDISHVWAKALKSSQLLVIDQLRRQMARNDWMNPELAFFRIWDPDMQDYIMMRMNHKWLVNQGKNIRTPFVLIVNKTRLAVLSLQRTKILQFCVLRLMNRLNMLPSLMHSSINFDHDFTVATSHQTSLKQHMILHKPRANLPASYPRTVVGNATRTLFK